MKKIFLLIVVLLAWAFTTINTSGWGISHNTPLLTVIAISIWYLHVKRKVKYSIPLGGSNILLSLFTFLSFIFLPLVLACSFDGVTYLSMILLIYCFSQQKITTAFINVTGFTFAALGLLVLYIFNYTSLFSEWDENEIAMISLFSFLYFLISVFGQRSFFKMLIMVVVVLLYLPLLISTNCRSAFLFINLSVLFVFWGGLTKKLLNKNIILSFALSIPLIIASVLCLFPDLEIFQFINDISVTNFQKEASSGRDIIWYNSFKSMPDSYFLGVGKIKINYHNSAVAILSVFGVIGYICWYLMLKKSLVYLIRYMSDGIIFGCIMVFLIIFWQQSFDLGFVHPYPNMIPYMILGIGFGRANTINKRCCHGNQL